MFPTADQLQKAIQSNLHPAGKEFLSGMGMNEMFRCLQGENLVGLKLENATPWGVIDTLRLACVDYVAEVVPFGLRSTLFFGKDWWPYHFAYNAKFFDQTKAQQTDQADSLALGRTDPDAEPFFRRRPLLQAHYCHSGVNLIASEIEASQEGWYTAVQSIGSFAGSLQTDTTEMSNVQFLDTDIFPAQQRMKLVTSGLYSTNAMRTDEQLASLNLGGAAESAATGGLISLSTNVQNNYAVGVLHDEVRQMYRGNVAQQGNAWVRPRDFMHFVDSMRQISGPVEVREVVHSFSPRGGFVSTWTPDCVAYAHDTQKLGLFSHAMSAMTRYYAAVTGYKAMRAGGSLRLRNGTSKALKFFGALDEKTNRRVGAVPKYAAYQTKRIGRNLFDATPLGKKYADYTRTFKSFTQGQHGIVDSDIKTAFENELGDSVLAFRHGGRNKGITGVRLGQAPHMKFGPIKIGLPRYYDTAEEVKQEVLEKTTARVLKKQFELTGKALSTDEEISLKSYVAKIVDKASKGEADADSFLAWLGRAIEPGAKNFYVAVTEGLKKNSVVREALTRTEKPMVSRSTLKVFQDTIGKKNPALRKALKASLGGNDEVGLAEYVARFETSVKLREERVKKLKAKYPDVREGTHEAALVTKAEDGLKSQKNALKALQMTLGKTGKAGTMIRAAGKIATSEKTVAAVTKVGRGAARLSEFLVMAVVGPAITTLNRYLASRQALKILPLRNCGKEWTAGILGHLGACVGPGFIPRRHCAGFRQEGSRNGAYRPFPCQKKHKTGRNDPRTSGL